VPIEIAFLIPVDRPTAQDFVGPWEVISRWGDVNRHLVASKPGLIETDSSFKVEIPEALHEIPQPDLILVPGTSEPFKAIRDTAAVDWLREMAPGARWVTSVCTGAGVLAAAGLLQGKKATTHWSFRKDLASMGVNVVSDRVVFEGNIVTGAGIMAGVDMALEVSLREKGQDYTEAIQLSMEYDPAPPVDSGSLEKAGPEVKAWTVNMFDQMVDHIRPDDWGGLAEVRS
jgi:cyclohexyl-isocyanide hydratase